MTTEPAVDTTLKLIPLAEIITNPANPRKDMDSDAAKTALAELADSVAERGILHNLVVTTWKNLGKKDDEKRYMIIAGERHYRASLALIEDGRWKKDVQLPCRVLFAGGGAQPGDIPAIMLLENLQRSDLAPLEEAAAFKILTDEHKMSPSEIAKKIGKSTRHVQLRLALVTKLAPEAHKRLSAGKIPLTVARALAQAPIKKQEQILKDIDIGRVRMPDAERVTELVRADFIRVENTLFDRADYDGGFEEDDDGKECFADKIQFMRLQKKAAKMTLAGLLSEGKATWIAIVARPPYWYSGNNPGYDDTKFGKTKDPRKSGTVVSIDSKTGKAQTITGLRKLPQPDHPDYAAERAKYEEERKKEDQRRDKRRKAAAEFNQRLSGLARDPAEFLTKLAAAPTSVAKGFAQSVLRALELFPYQEADGFEIAAATYLGLEFPDVFKPVPKAKPKPAKKKKAAAKKK